MSSDQPQPSASPNGRTEQGASLSEWQPMETAPKDGTPVLGHFNEYSFPVRWIPSPVHKHLLGWHVMPWEPVSFIMVVSPTHWMPIPPPPNAPTADQPTPSA